METYEIIAYIVAAVCFAAGVLAPSQPAWLSRVIWVPLGLLAWVSVPMILAIRAK